MEIHHQDNEKVQETIQLGGKQKQLQINNLDVPRTSKMVYGNDGKNWIYFSKQHKLTTRQHKFSLQTLLRKDEKDNIDQADDGNYDRKQPG